MKIFLLGLLGFLLTVAAVSDTSALNCLEINRGINYKLNFNDDIIELTRQDGAKPIRYVVTQNPIQDRYLVSSAPVINSDGSWHLNVLTFDTEKLIIEEGALDPLDMKMWFAHTSYKCFKPIN